MNPLGMNVAFDGAFHWLLAAFGAFTLITLAWLLVGPWVRRLELAHVRCPRDGRDAYVVFRVGRRGRRELVSCSVEGRALRPACRCECLTPEAQLPAESAVA